MVHVSIICKSLAGLKNYRRTHKSFTKADKATSVDTPVVIPDNVNENEFGNAYEKMTIWRKNTFQLPKRNAGKSFIQELTNAIDICNNKSRLRDVALTSEL